MESGQNSTTRVGDTSHALELRSQKHIKTMKSLTAAQRKAPAHELPKRSWRKSRELERYAKMEELRKKGRNEPRHVAEEAVAKATGVHNPKGNGRGKN